jgi:hypothetical protein
MGMRIAFLFLSLALAQTAQADLSVWEQMESGRLTASKGVVKSVDYRDLDVYVKIETAGPLGTTVENLTKLCRDSDWSIDLRATLFKAKIEVLEDSRKRQVPVEFGTRGPFDSCLSFIRSTAS